MRPDMNTQDIAQPVPLAAPTDAATPPWWSLVFDDVHCVLDRVAQLELATQTPTLIFAMPDATCGACDDHCSEPGFTRPLTSTLE